MGVAEYLSTHRAKNIKKKKKVLLLIKRHNRIFSVSWNRFSAAESSCESQFTLAKMFPACFSCAAVIVLAGHIRTTV